LVFPWHRPKKWVESLSKNRGLCGCTSLNIAFLPGLGRRDR
jgi:hypothetical protein